LGKRLLIFRVIWDVLASHSPTLLVVVGPDALGHQPRYPQMLLVLGECAVWVELPCRGARSTRTRGDPRGARLLGRWCGDGNRCCPLSWWRRLRQFVPPKLVVPPIAVVPPGATPPVAVVPPELVSPPVAVVAAQVRVSARCSSRPPGRGRPGFVLRLWQSCRPSWLSPPEASGPTGWSWFVARLRSWPPVAEGAVIGEHRRIGDRQARPPPASGMGPPSLPPGRGDLSSLLARISGGTMVASGAGCCPATVAFARRCHRFRPRPRSAAPGDAERRRPRPEVFFASGHRSGYSDGSIQPARDTRRLAVWLAIQKNTRRPETTIKQDRRYRRRRSEPRDPRLQSPSTSTAAANCLWFRPANGKTH